MSETNLYTVSVPALIRGLKGLTEILNAAEAHALTRKTERLDFETALLNDRLVFDQFPLVRQVQIATDNAKNSIGRITGRDMPVFEDSEQSFAELQTRVQSVIEILEAVKPDDIIGKEDAVVSLPYWKGKSMHGFEYVTEYLLPNFYFHVATAYAIVRKNGIVIGKSHYIGTLSLKDL
jgi:hypothetical protein